jgi:ketosteroid isomerase-like protein
MKNLVLLLALCGIVHLQTNAQNWNEVIKAVASDRAETDFYGYSVAIDGNYAFVGAYLEDEDATGNNSKSAAGSVYIYEKDINGNWSEIQKIVPSDRNSSDQFGWSVSVSGDYAIIGAHWEDQDATGSNTKFNAGAAYIFEKNGAGVWAERQKIVASDRDLSDEFGEAVAISGTYAIVGAYKEDEDVAGNNTLSSAGAAYIFERDGAGVWNEVQKVVAADRGWGDTFGEKLAISGDYAIIGAMEEDEDVNGNNTMSNAGSAYVFERDGNGNWNQTQKLVAQDRNHNDKYARSIAVNGSYAVIGAAFEDHNEFGTDSLGNAGSAYLYERDNWGNWVQVQKLVASDREGADNFGWSVGIDSLYVVIGANLEDHDAAGNDYKFDAGAAYVFVRETSGVWMEDQKIVASDRSDLDIFGSSIAISGTDVIVGAYWEDHNVAGMDSMDRAGAMYIFETCLVDAGVTQVGNILSANSLGLTYQWIDCNNGFAPIPGEINQEYNATANGTYAVIVNDNGCIDTSQCFSVVSLGLVSNNTAEDIFVYPNPTKGETTISLGADYQQATIEVMDPTGKLISTKTEYNVRQIKCEVPEVSGMYFVAVKTEMHTTMLKVIRD